MLPAAGTNTVIWAFIAGASTGPCEQSPAHQATVREVAKSPKAD